MLGLALLIEEDNGAGLDGITKVRPGAQDKGEINGIGYDPSPGQTARIGGCNVRIAVILYQVKAI